MLRLDEFGHGNELAVGLLSHSMIIHEARRQSKICGKPISAREVSLRETRMRMRLLRRRAGCAGSFTVWGFY